jgi:hypothetical protein
MSEEKTNKELTDQDICRIWSIVQRHVSNLENTMAMMRNGHFIDAYNRITATKEGLIFIKSILDDHVEGIKKLSKSQNENNTQ